MKKTKEDCERAGGHEYAMIYNDGTTCMDCGYHRPVGEESGEIRSVSGVVVPSLLCDLARALPEPKCPPEHTLRERDDACKACIESRDELQQLVGDGDLNAIAVVVGVYLRRLYEMHDHITTSVASLKAQILVYKGIPEFESLGVWAEEIDTMTGVLEMIFGEVLSEQDRDLPTDEEFLDSIREYIGASSNEEAAQVLAKTLKKVQGPQIRPLTIERCKDPNSERVFWIEALTPAAVAWVGDVAARYGRLQVSVKGVEWKFDVHMGCDPDEVFEYLKSDWQRTSNVEGEL